MRKRTLYLLCFAVLLTVVCGGKKKKNGRKRGGKKGPKGGIDTQCGTHRQFMKGDRVKFHGAYNEWDHIQKNDEVEVRTTSGFCHGNISKKGGKKKGHKRYLEIKCNQKKSRGQYAKSGSCKTPRHKGRACAVCRIAENEKDFDGLKTVEGRYTWWGIKPLGLGLIATGTIHKSEKTKDKYIHLAYPKAHNPSNVVASAKKKKHKKNQRGRKMFISSWDKKYPIVKIRMRYKYKLENKGYMGKDPEKSNAWGQGTGKSQKVGRSECGSSPYCSWSKKGNGQCVASSRFCEFRHMGRSHKRRDKRMCDKIKGCRWQGKIRQGVGDKGACTKKKPCGKCLSAGLGKGKQGL